MKVLEIKDLNYYYIDGSSQRIILDNINISFDKGIFYTILGESGSGKTTFLSLIAGLDTPKHGSIIYKGKNINDIGLDNYRKHNVSIVFQNYNLIPYFNAYDNIMIAMDISKNYEHINKDTIFSLLNYFGITKTKATRPVNKLSGGEQQRVAIARALSTNAEIIIADEPTGNLDIQTSNYIVDIFKDLARNYHKTIIMVTHNERIANESDITYRINGNTKTLELVNKNNQK